MFGYLDWRRWEEDVSSPFTTKLDESRVGADEADQAICRSNCWLKSLSRPISVKCDLVTLYFANDLHWKSIVNLQSKYLKKSFLYARKFGEQ